MKLYKLTESNNQSKNGMTWGQGRTNQLPIKDNAQLCSSDLIHTYKSFEYALVLNYIHNNIQNPILWEAEGEAVKEDWDKVGCFSLTTIRQIPIPNWFLNTQIRRKIYAEVMKRLSDKAVFNISNDFFLSRYTLISQSNNSQEQHSYFRELLQIVYAGYELRRMGKCSGLETDSAFLVYQNIFCQLDTSTNYYDEHIACMLETGHAIGIDSESVLKESIKEIMQI